MNERIKNIVRRDGNDKLVINCLDLEFLFSGMIKKCKTEEEVNLVCKRVYEALEHVADEKVDLLEESK